MIEKQCSPRTMQELEVADIETYGFDAEPFSSAKRMLQQQHPSHCGGACAGTIRELLRGHSPTSIEEYRRSALNDIINLAKHIGAIK